MNNLFMKASVLEAVNTPFIFKDVTKPIPQVNEVQVKLYAAALNHRDIWIQKGQYAGLKFPIICGSDGCGVITGIGEHADAKWLNQEVVINPSINWGDNSRVQARDYTILGLPENGTFAQYVCVPEHLVHQKPAHLTVQHAAAIPLAGLTAFRVLFSRAKAIAGETVLITGAGGGVALFATQFAIAAGCRVYVSSSSDAKIEQAKQLGATGGANYKTADWNKTLAKESGGFDVIIDGAGGEGFARLTDLAKPGGRIGVYGATQGNWNSGIPARTFWKQLDILGSTMGTPHEFVEMLNFVSKQRIVPVIDSVFSLDETETAARYMDGGNQYGKIVIDIES
ncbi:MAG: zinc-binding dehydrogenase [Bacteroidota bacterium]|nr:zinc-binding dehydrogenase [Bacteroidota bacterium]